MERNIETGSIKKVLLFYYYFVLLLGQLAVVEPSLISLYFLGIFDYAISLEQIQLNNNKLSRIFYPSFDELHKLFGDVESQGDCSPFRNLRNLFLGTLSRFFNNCDLFINSFNYFSDLLYFCMYFRRQQH